MFFKQFKHKLFAYIANIEDLVCLKFSQEYCKCFYLLILSTVTILGEGAAQECS